MSVSTLPSTPRTAGAEISAYKVAKLLREVDDCIYLILVRRGLYDLGGRIPSFREFDGMRRRDVARQLGISFNDTYRYLHDDGLKKLYVEYVAGRFDRGGRIADRHWRIMDFQVKKAVAHTLRGKLAGLTEQCASVNDAPRLPLNDKGDPILRGRRRH